MHRKGFWISGTKPSWLPTKKVEPRRGLIVKRALITGVTGQDGSYFAEFLLEKGYSARSTPSSRLLPASAGERCRLRSSRIAK
ncbi:GDP-mannose 4,6-dehydratase [Haliea sp. E1-2-M8]|uniref:GDP-mannose 4,6-dehydratase n=1 Tax=Haliea sp. E1-2-M8 TaxID=3064706 RepID=UPI00351C0082